MQVKDIMTRDVIFVSPETKITEVAQILYRNRFHGMPVVSDGKVVGIITERDFFTQDSDNLFLPTYIDFLKENRTLKNLSKEEQAKVEKLFNSRAKDIMNDLYVPILEDADIKNLLEFFRTTKYATIPVIDINEKLVGIVTLSDILNLIRV